MEDFKNHKFFEGIDWDRVPTITPPYLPEYSSPTDTSNFDVDDMEDSSNDQNAQPSKSLSAFTGNHLPFIGFTYTTNS